MTLCTVPDTVLGALRGRPPLAILSPGGPLSTHRRPTHSSGEHSLCGELRRSPVLIIWERERAPEHEESKSTGLPHLRRTSANTPPHPPSDPEAGPSCRRGKLRLGKCEPFAQRARLLRDSRTSAVSTILNVWDGNPGSGSHTQSHPPRPLQRDPQNT